MNSTVDQPVFTQEQYINLTRHSKQSVRKWASERLMEQSGNPAMAALSDLIDDPVEEIAIRVMSYLAEKQYQPAAPRILERFQQAAANLPAKSVLASWCAQALGKLNYASALPEFAKYLSQHPGDVAILGISSALGDIHQAEARQQLLDLLKTLETSKDGDIPYLGDVVVDALLKFRQPEDIPRILRQHQIWQNLGKKNPRTLAALALTTGDNNIYHRLDTTLARGEGDWFLAVQQEANLLEISLTKLLGAEIADKLHKALKDKQPAQVIELSLTGARKILSSRYGSLDALRDYNTWNMEQLRQKIAPSFLRDQLSLVLLEGLVNPQYKIHQSHQDPITSKKQALLALTGLLEIAARQDYQATLARTATLSKLIYLLTSPRYYVPVEFEDLALAMGLSAGPELDLLLDAVASDRTTYGEMRAVRLLGKLKHLAAIPDLVKRLESTADWMRDVAIKALVQMGPPVLNYIEDFMPEINPEVWARLAEVLAQLPYERSAELAYQAWLNPNILQSDSLFMVQERIGSQEAIARLWEIYQDNSQLAGPSLELLCDIHEYDFPELAEVREANRQDEEELTAYQQNMWQQLTGKTETKTYNEKEIEEENAQEIAKYLQEDNPPKPKPVKSVKIARNDPCPCGSGKKYKKCCGNKAH
ncbi:MAG: SEC-C metal-binding domain-containing protein [Bacillota bacterium]|jgi:HEAT repeat protein